MSAKSAIRGPKRDLRRVPGEHLRLFICSRSLTNRFARSLYAAS
jgi:hypothetical protein